MYSLVVSVSECLYLCEIEGAVGGERGDLAGVFGDVAVKARCWILKVLHVFVHTLYFPLKSETDKTPLSQNDHYIQIHQKVLGRL